MRYSLTECIFPKKKSWRKPERSFEATRWEQIQPTKTQAHQKAIIIHKRQFVVTYKILYSWKLDVKNFVSLFTGGFLIYSATRGFTLLGSLTSVVVVNNRRRKIMAKKENAMANKYAVQKARILLIR